jgi:hypothetical protein
VKHSFTTFPLAAGTLVLEEQIKQGLWLGGRVSNGNHKSQGYEQKAIPNLVRMQVAK